MVERQRGINVINIHNSFSTICITSVANTEKTLWTSMCMIDIKEQYVSILALNLGRNLLKDFFFFFC